MKIKLLIEYLGFCLLLFTTQFNKPLYLSKSDYLYELSIIAAEAFQRTGQQVFRTVTKNIETNPLDGYPRLDKVQKWHNGSKVFKCLYLDVHIKGGSGEEALREHYGNRGCGVFKGGIQN